MRRLYRSRGRQRGALVQHAGRRRGGEADNDHRGRRRHARGQGRAVLVGETRRRAMRLLPVRPDHVGRRAAGEKPEADRLGHRSRHVRERLPVRDLCANPRRDQGGIDGIGLGPGEPAMKSISDPARRAFLKVGALAGAGLTLAFWLPRAFVTGGPAAPPNAFVRVGTDNTVTVISKHLEMGQGVHTGLATLVAEEIDADWSQVRVEGAPADAKVYNNLSWGPAQGTGGSSSVANSWEQMRRAGAAARAMLVAAAADTWKLPADEIAVSQGVVTHKSGRKATF